MADPAYNFLSPTDLSGFTQQVQANDPYGLIGKGIAQWQPDYSVMSPTATGLTAFGRAFTAGLLQNYSQNRASEQLDKVVGILPQLKANPYSITAPEGVDAGAFNLLKGSAILKDYQKKAELEDLSKKFDSDILMRVLGKQADVMGEAAGKKAVYGDLSKDPESPGYKAEKDKMDTLDTLRDKFNKLPEVTNFSQVSKAATAMAGALKDKGSPSDLELVRYAVQMIEPGMAVREGEQKAVMQSGSIPDQWKGELNKTLANGTALGDTVREGLKRLASRAYEAQKSGYDKANTYYNGLARGRGLLGESEDISYLGQALPSESIFGTVTAPPVAPSISEIDAALARKGYYPDGSPMGK